MPVTLTCANPACGKRLQVPDAVVGKLIKCPLCAHTQTAAIAAVPAALPALPSPVPPPPPVSPPSPPALPPLPPTLEAADDMVLPPDAHPKRRREEDPQEDRPRRREEYPDDDRPRRRGEYADDDRPRRRNEYSDEDRPRRRRERYDCPSCGAPLHPEDERCPDCRRPVDREEIRRDAEDPRELDRGSDVPFPMSIKTAGIIWILFGCLILVNLIILLVGTFMLTSATGSGAVLSTGICTGIVVGLFGAAFLFVGVQSVQGTAADALGNGVGSIIFAVFAVGAGLWNFSVNQSLQGVIGLVEGGGLLAAGVLALTGRADYKIWRRAHKGGRRRRRD